MTQPGWRRHWLLWGLGALLGVLLCSSALPWAVAQAPSGSFDGSEVEATEATEATEAPGATQAPGASAPSDPTDRGQAPSDNPLEAEPPEATPGNSEGDGTVPEELPTPENLGDSAAAPDCTLSSHGVRVANYGQTLFCIEAWFQDESPQERVSRVQAQIEAVVSGRINLESLGLRRGRTLDEVLTPSTSRQENDGELDRQLVGLVSNMPALRGRDRLVLLVTPLDVALQADTGNLSPVSLATEQFDTIKQAVDQVSDEVAWVTFNWGWGPYWLQRWRSPALDRQAGETTPGLRANQELLFPIQKSNDFYNAAYRGAIITQKLSELARRFFDPATLDLQCSEFQGADSQGTCDGAARLMVAKTSLMTVYPADAVRASQELTFSEGPPLTPYDLAQRYQTEIQQRLRRYALLYRLHAALTLGATLACLAFTRAMRRSKYWASSWIPAVVTLYLASRLPLFPLDALLNAVSSSWTAFLAYLVEDFFQLMTVVVVTAIALSLLWLATRLLLGRNARRKMIFSLLSLVVVAFAVVVASPYLPGAGTAYLAGVSAFAVLAFSLSAQAAIGDVIAGFVLVFITDLEKGDWVCLGAVTGELVEQNLFVHKVRTSKNVIVTLQNNAVLSSLISKFGTGDRPKTGRPNADRPNADRLKTIARSTVRLDLPQGVANGIPPPPLAAEPATLIAHTTVTLGYDVPWRKVHHVLTQAAQKTDGLTRPFVLQTSLDDYYVSYELNAYLDEQVEPKTLPRIYSDLHKHIQDECNRTDIEILSPHYRAVRDGSDITIPADDWADRDDVEQSASKASGA